MASQEITRRIEIDAGHRVPRHEGGCRYIHGHRYRIEATVQGVVVGDTAERSDAGMVIDFGILKQVMMDGIHALYDHRLILWQDDPLLTDPDGAFLHAVQNAGLMTGVIPVPCIPTAENLARLWGEAMQQELQRRVRGTPLLLRLTRMTVYETPNSIAVWTPDPMVAP